jgi:hypothetical protein
MTMRTSLLAAGAAAALLTAGAAIAQNSGQSDEPSARHQNSAHATAPGGPDQTNAGGMSNTAMPGNDRDDRTNAGNNMQSAPDRMGGPDRARVNENGMGDRDRMRMNESGGMGNRESVRINENGGGAHLRLTTTQRTRIRDVVVRAHGPRLTHVSFRVGVGARVPRDVRIAVLPPEIVAIAPEWQGYSYFEYGDQIVIVDPASFAIVATLPL